MKILKFLVLSGILFPLTSISQENENSASQPTTISTVFVEQNPQDEIYRLQEKRENLVYRYNILSQDTLTNQEELLRTQGMIAYIDKKIETLQHTLAAEEFAISTGAPDKAVLTKEEYIQQRQEWEDSIRATNTNVNIPIKTTLTRYEFEKLPLPQQEKILSMPERYTIVD